MLTWENGTPFKETLLAEPAVAEKVKPALLDEIMDPKRYLVHADAVFKRVEAIEA